MTERIIAQIFLTSFLFRKYQLISQPAPNPANPKLISIDVDGGSKNDPPICFENIKPRIVKIILPLPGLTGLELGSKYELTVGSPTDCKTDKAEADYTFTDNTIAL